MLSNFYLFYIYLFILFQLDENLEPNYNKMIERIDKLNVDHDLKKDMLNGIDYCRQFAVSFIGDKVIAIYPLTLPLTFFLHLNLIIF